MRIAGPLAAPMLVLAAVLAACGAASATPVPTASQTPVATPTIEPSPTPAPAMTVDGVQAAFHAFNLTCDGSGGEWSCFTANPSANTRLILLTTGENESELTRVRVAYVVLIGTANQDQAMEYFEVLAALPYAGSNPNAAVAWVRDSWEEAMGADPVETDIGPGHFVLHVVAAQGGGDISLELQATEDFFE
jgi:hypothetical protein